MGPLFTRARALAYERQRPAGPLPKPRPLSHAATLGCWLLTLALAPLLLLAFLLLGERPRL